ncbi:transcription termination factor MTERF4, chloroplastic [Gastrolobium bilobum]|uniref:transcription termination factor MTERF4, chloroplastic n=1 Tax=Gastrolobium bilobum TaxID=150636 RepID=UPI002AAFF114|nr:transcription termination factor MTERF4, chloroplastic [Gastrolobium bilobum]
MLSKLHSNPFLPIALPRQIQSSLLNSKCISFTHPHPPSPFEVHYYHTRLRTRRRSNCRCGSGSGSGSGSDSVSEGRMAVSSFLQQFGVSEEDSLSIASNSPAYLNMLMEGVRDLEQLWDFDSDSDKQIAGSNFKEKLLHIAAHKGDNGKVAYLESLGFTLSWSMNLARYLSDDTLPSLMHKVTYMKQLTHSDEFLIKNIRRMMLHLSISIDEDLQHTLSFFEKVEARRGGLNVLASKDSAFHYLVESFPRLLLLSVNNHMTRTVDFLESIGIPRFRIPNIILGFPPILLWNVQVLKTRVLALNEIDVVDKDHVKLLLKYPWVLSTSIQENYKEILDFLYSEQIPKTWIDSAIKSQPHLLGCSTSKLKLMLDHIAELGVQSKKLDRVIAKSPQLLLRKPKDFLQVVLFFENIGFDKETIGRILARCPEIFAASIDKTLQRKIEFLYGVGVCKTYLPKVIRKYPEVLLSDIDQTLPQRIMYLMKSGISEKDVAFMVRTFSPLLGYSIEEVLRPKIEFLVNSMERPLGDVVDYPRYFSYSLEKRIKPRHWVLKGRNIECSLKDMLGKNDEEFACDFMGVGGMLDPPPPPPSSHDRL